MATVTAVENGIQAKNNFGEMAHVQWGPLTSTNLDGAAVKYAEFADMCVQIDGTFGTATITLQGSNDLTAPTNWFTLTDPQGNGIAKVTGGGAVQGEQVLESPVWVRPLASGADGTTSINVRLKFRRSRGKVY